MAGEAPDAVVKAAAAKSGAAKKAAKSKPKKPKPKTTGASAGPAPPVKLATAPVTPTVHLIFVEPDPFLGSMRRAAAYVPKPDYVETVSAKSDAYWKAEHTQNVRNEVARPAGISVKPNTYATARIIDANGDAVMVLNQVGQSSDTQKKFSDSDYVNDRWTDWLLLAVREQRAEKTQIVETFGDTYIYAFGQRPRMLSFSGLLLNTADYNWRAVFWENWDKHFRATQLVRANARMYITFDDILVEGYPLDASADQSANDPNSLNFTFSFFVTNYVNLTASSDFARERKNKLDFVRPGFDVITENGKVVPPTLVDERVSIARLLGTGGIAKLASEVYDRASPDMGPQLAALVGGTVYDLLHAASKAVYDPTVAEVSIASLQTHAVSRIMGTLQQGSIAALEQRANLMPGEINTLIGLNLLFANRFAQAMDRGGDTIFAGTLGRNLAKQYLDAAGAVAKVGGLSGMFS